MRFKVIYLLLFWIFLAYSFLGAQEYAIALKISTLGLSFEGIRSFGTNFTFRTGFSLFNYQSDSDFDEEDWQYNAQLRLLSFSNLIDWYPFRSGFHVTGGALVNLTEGNFKLYPMRTYKVGGTLYTPELLGVVSAKINLNKVAPYLGIGFGKPTHRNHFYFSIDLGVIYQGAPGVDVTATGLLEPTAEQELLIEDNIQWFQFYPVISLGINIHFKGHE